jgi:hypothetical protein
MDGPTVIQCNDSQDSVAELWYATPEAETPIILHITPQRRLYHSNTHCQRDVGPF